MALCHRANSALVCATHIAFFFDMDADFLARGEVFWHLHHQTGRQGCWFVAGTCGCTFDARSRFHDFQIHGLRQLQRQQHAIPGQNLHVRHPAFRNKEEFFFNLIFGEDIRGVIFFIHEHVFVAINVGKINIAAGQGHGINDIVTFKTFFHFQTGTHIGETHFVQRCCTTGARGLNIDIFHNQQLAVVIQYHTFLNFVRSWHCSNPVYGW
ncbi:hypothetical protein EcWSU1_03082 [Enterobacter ludwigii]|uniref:Uncharacterized protein n=1 Tax=Enterobacter ludwigii TaxID=299767 RepID=G8LJW2_9ENTR|nr:hypothetical protein EcWSU1_03082 [Enterobacter ludwigii]